MMLLWNEIWTVIFNLQYVTWLSFALEQTETEKPLITYKMLYFVVVVPTGCVTYKRRVLDGPTMDQWSQSDNQITDCLFTSQGFIEDAEGAVQVC